MLEDVVNSLISRFLGEYIKDIDKNDLKVSIWKGDVKFRNLEVKTEALDFLNLPVEIKSGYIGELQMRIPWKNIGRKPTKVQVRNVYVVVCPRSEVKYDEEAFAKRDVELKRQRLKAIDEKEAKRMKELHEKEDNSLVNTMVSKIIQNFELLVEDVHIRYEDHSSDPKHPFSAGVTLHSLVISPNQERESGTEEKHNGLFSKNLLIDKVGVYWDSDSKLQVRTDDVDSLNKDMELPFHKSDDPSTPAPRHFVLHPLSLSVLLDLDIRGTELRKPLPEAAALQALEELKLNKDTLVNAKLVQSYVNLERVRGRSQKDEVELFVKQFMKDAAKFCSNENMTLARSFAATCWKYINTASPVVKAMAIVPQLTLTVLQSQIRDLTGLLDSLTLQMRRAQQPVNRPKKDVLKRPRRWWQYAINCVLKQNAKKRAAVTWKDYLEFKNQRNEYITLYKRVLKAPGLPSIKKDKKALKRKQELEDIFSVENTVLFRKMAQLEIDKDLDQQAESSSSDEEEEMRTELYKELELSSEDVNPWEGGQPMDILFSVDFALESTHLMLKKEEQEFMDLIVGVVSLRAYKRKDFLELWTMVSDLQVRDRLSDKTRYPMVVSVRRAPTPDAPPLLPADLLKVQKNPFVEGHIEVPSLDGSGDVKVVGRVQTVDVTLNVPWVLEMLRFLVPQNRILMSHYVEKAYAMVTKLREGNANLIAVAQNNHGMSLDLRVAPVNVIVPSDCMERRSKTQLLLAQIGEVVVSAVPKSGEPDPQRLADADLYNVITVQVKQVAVGVMNGRTYADRTLPLAVLSDVTENCLLLPFDVDVELGLCLVNEVRYVSTHVGVKVAPISVRVTKSLIDAAVAWVCPVLSAFLSKQRELELNVMDLLLQPKQLLFSCIAYDGSPLLSDHDISAWKEGSNQQKLLHRLVTQTQKETKQRHPLGEALIQPASVTLDCHVVQTTHGVMHLTYEDLVLLQYKPMMTMDVCVRGISIAVHAVEDVLRPLVELQVGEIGMTYADHFYDMDIGFSVASLCVKDFARADQLALYGVESGTPPLLLETPPSEEAFVEGRFITVGALSMLNDVYKAATNLFVTMGSIHCHLNAAIVCRLLPLIPTLPSLDQSGKTSPAPATPIYCPKQQQDGLLDLHVRTKTLEVDVLQDNGASLLSVSLDGLQATFHQSRIASHICLALRDVCLTDCSQKDLLYPSVLRIEHTESEESFLSADVKLVNGHTDLADTTMDVHISAPVVVLRMRFVKQLLQYLETGSLGCLLRSFASPKSTIPVQDTSSVDVLTSSGLHAIVSHAVDSLFAVLVSSNLIRPLSSDGHVFYVLPRVNVSLQNLVVMIPAGSESREMLRFELGMMKVGNGVQPTAEKRSALFAQGSRDMATSISMQLEGLGLMTVYAPHEALVTQSVLGGVNVSLTVLLHTILYTSIHISPLVVTANQSQVSFVLTRLLRNLSEEPSRVEVKEVPRLECKLFDGRSVEESPVVPCESGSDGALVESVVKESALVEPTISENAVKEAAVNESVPSETALNETTPNDSTCSHWIGEAFYTEMTLDGVYLEVLKNEGGYNDAGGQSLVKCCGSSCDSLFVLQMKTICLNSILTTTHMTLGFSVSSVSLRDTRAHDLLPQFSSPIAIGDGVTPALTITISTSEELREAPINVGVSLHRCVVFPTPLFAEILSVIPAFLQALPKGASPMGESMLPPADEPLLPPADDPTPSSPTATPFIALPPLLLSLLSLLRLRIQIDPVTVYIPSSFSVPAPLLLVNFALDSSVQIASSLDVGVKLLLDDVRVAHCSLDQLAPMHDWNDMLQSWSLQVTADITKCFKVFAVEVSDPSEMHLIVGMRDVDVLLCFLQTMLDVLPKTAEKAEGSESVPVPVVRLPCLVSETGESSLSVVLKLSLHAIQVSLMNDVSSVEVPFLQAQIGPLQATCELDKQLVAVLRSQLLVDFYNQDRIAWEPLVEPWEVMAQVTQHPIPPAVIEKALAQGTTPPPQTSCVLSAEKVMNVNVTTAVCSAGLHFLSDLQKHSKREETPSVQNGYYIYVENCLDEEVTFGIEDDGGLNSQMKRLKTAWERIDRRVRDLRCAGPLYVHVEGEDVQLCWVELFREEPHVRVFSNTVRPCGEAALSQYTSRPDSVVLSQEGVLFQFTDQTSSRIVSTFATTEEENQRWLCGLTESQSTQASSDDTEETIVVPANARVCTALPAHPSFNANDMVESYNQRLVSVGVRGYQRVQFCCDNEGDVPFVIASSDGSAKITIRVRICNNGGLRVIQLASLFSLRHYCSVPLYARFVSEDSVQGATTLYQSQMKQTNLDDLHVNYFGTPVGPKSPFFDAQTLGVVISHPKECASPLPVEPGKKLFCPLSFDGSGRLELLGSDVADSLSSCVHNSLSLADVTSRNLRRCCLNVGTPDVPRFVLLRTECTPLAGSRISSASFAVVIVPVMKLRNLLPITMEYRVLRKSASGSCSFPVSSPVDQIAQRGSIESGRSAEITCVDGRSIDQYAVLVRPMNSQFVWGQQMIPVVTEGKGECELADMESNHVSVQYAYASVSQGGDTLSETLELSVYSLYWVVNRTKDTLFIAGKEEKPVQRLPGEPVAVSLESTPSEAPLLQPVLFSAGGSGKKTVIRLRKGNSPWSARVSLEKQSCETVRIPASPPYTRFDSLYSVSVQRAQKPFEATRVLVISPRYVFVNRTSHDLILWQETESIALPASSGISWTEFLPSSQHMLRLSKDAESRSAPFSCDSAQPIDLQLASGMETLLLSVKTSLVDDLHTVSIDLLKPEDIGYCVSNSTALDCVTVLQSTCDLSSGVSVMPMASRMFILPSPMGPRQVSLFFKQLTAPEGASAFVPVVNVDLDKVGVVATISRANPKRTVEVVVEAEDTTRTLIIRDALSTEDAAWEQKKTLAFMRSVLEEGLSVAAFAYRDTDTVASDFIAAFEDFERHARVQPENKGVNLLLNDQYYWIYLRNASIQGLHRKYCTVTVRVSNGERMETTESKRGSNVFFGKEMTMRKQSDTLFVKVIVAFEKETQEFDLSVPYVDEVNTVKSLCVPFRAAESLEQNRVCDGGVLYLSLVHCHNNLLTDAQQEYLPRLLQKRDALKEQLRELYQARRCLEYERHVIGFHSQKAGLSRSFVASRGGDESLMQETVNPHVQRALRRGDYANAPDSEAPSVEEVLHDLDSESNQEVEADAFASQIADLEREKLLVVELLAVRNVPAETQEELQATVQLGDRSFILGHPKAVARAAEYSSKPLEVVFKKVRLGCRFAVMGDGRVVVTRVVKDSEAEKQGVCPGMVLYGINGKVAQGLGMLVDKKVKELPRPLSLTFMAPFRLPTTVYDDVQWTGRTILPAEATIGQSSMRVEVRRGASLVYAQDVKIHRFAKWEGSVGDATSPTTSCVFASKWVDRSTAFDRVDTAITVSLAGVDVSVVDSVPREVLNAGLRGVSVGWTTMLTGKQSIDLSLSKLQVDNQLLNAMEPVLVGRVKPDESSALQLSVVLPSRLHILTIEYLRVRLCDLFVAMDNRLLVALIQLISSVPLDLLVTTSDTPLALDVFRPELRIPATTQSSRRLFAEQWTIEKTSIAISNKIDPATTTTGVFLPPIPALLPLQTLLDTLCGLVADIDRTTLRFDEFSLQTFFGPSSDLVRRLALHYVAQGSRQVLKLLGSINLLGNPVGLVEDVSNGVRALVSSASKDPEMKDAEYSQRLEEGLNMMWRSTAKGVFNTASKITSTIGNGVASLTFNKHYKEQRVMGRNGFLHGITSGVSGVVMDPIRGARRNGVRGALEGVGMGLAGVVTKPLSGLMDDTTRMLDSVKVAASGEKKLERLRLPRCVACDRVLRVYDNHTAFGQSLFATATTRFLVELEPGEQYVLHCCVDGNSHYLVVTQFHALLLEPNCDLLWCVSLRSVSVEEEDEEMRIIQGKQSRLLLFTEKKICSHMYGILRNIPLWTAKEIVQCSKDFVRFVETRYKRDEMVEKAYSRPAVDFRSLDLLSVCLISVDQRYERKMAGSYSVKATAYQEYCLEVVGGMDENAMASWRVYRRYSELRTLYKSIESALPKELRSVKFPGKKFQILGSHLSEKVLEEREQQMQVFVNECLSKEPVMRLAEVKAFLCTDAVNIRYEV